MNTMDGKRILVIYSNENTKGYVADATGAFIPEAKKLAQLYGVPSENMLGVPCASRQKVFRRDMIETFIRQHQDISWLTLFCHGWSSGIQFGFGFKELPGLVGCLACSCSKDLRVTIYACSTGSTSERTRNVGAPGTDNGFADKFRDHLLAAKFRNGWIDAHLTPGRAAANPFVVRFYTIPQFEDQVDLPGGGWIISPQSTMWPTWKRAMLDEKGTFRFEFPLMSEAQIAAELIRRGAA
jgi:hypothetical protein